jgi:hypothetical protein
MAAEAFEGVGDELAVLQNVGVADNEDSVNQQEQIDVCLDPISDPIVVIDKEEIVKSSAMPDFIYLCFSSVPSPSFRTFTHALISQLITPQIQHFVSKSHELDTMSDSLQHVDAPSQQTVGVKRARRSELTKTTTGSHPFPLPR